MGPRAPVTAAPAQVPRVGLIPTFSALADPGTNWEHGFAFAPENCGTAGRNAPCDSGAPKEVPDNLPVVEVEPFYIWAGDKCSPFDFTRERLRRASAQLEASESFQAAAELWTGSVAKVQFLPDGVTPWPNRWLASPESDVLNDPAGKPFGIVDALACLEQGLGDCRRGARGVIHCTRQLATHWAQRGMLRREGGTLLTYLDSLVIPDAGYDGSGPEGQAEHEGSQWAYGTDLLQVRLGRVSHYPAGEAPDDIAEGLDKDTNLLTYRAERLAAVSWDGCCHVAVEVDLPQCYVGGAS